MAEYFWGFKPIDTNLYIRLAYDLKDYSKEVVFTSLNYDTLLRSSFKKVGFDLDFYKKNTNHFELNLPHGCCNLFSDSVKAMNGYVKMDGLNIKVNGNERFVDIDSEFTKRINEEEIPPIMSYFGPTKNTMAGE
jgi:hypothetical protein